MSDPTARAGGASDEQQLPEVFKPGDVTASLHEIRRYNVQTTIGAILAGAALLSLLALVATSCYLAVSGGTGSARIAPLLQAFEPYLLPLLGGIVGYAFGKEQASNG